MEILGIDPGLKCCGLAMFSGEKLRTKSIRCPSGNELPERVSYICAEAKAFAPSVELLVIEHMTIYPLQKGDPNDLIDLSLLSGSLLATICHERAILVTPRTWKGQLPKDVHHKRIERRLGYPLDGISADARDAVGLALYGVDLTKRGDYLA